MLLNLVVIACLICVLLLVIFNDLRRMRIPNTLTLALLALFPLHAFGMPDWASVGYQIGFAAMVFAAGFAAFAIRAMGGGDVKILAGLALFIPITHLAEVFVIFAACIFVSIGFVLAARRISSDIEGNWVFLTAKKFPLGLPIGFSGLLVAAVSLAQ